MPVYAPAVTGTHCIYSQRDGQAELTRQSMVTSKHQLGLAQGNYIDNNVVTTEPISIAAKYHLLTLSVNMTKITLRQLAGNHFNISRMHDHRLFVYQFSRINLVLKENCTRVFSIHTSGYSIKYDSNTAGELMDID